MAPPKLPLLAALLLALLLLATPALSAPPENLSNFQNEESCAALNADGNASSPPPPTLIVRPRSLADARQAVRSYSPVQAVGAGHSWSSPFFCPGSNKTATTAAAGIAMTTIRPLRIVVDEEAQTVTADAGVIVADLLDYLSNYATFRAPGGYTLPAFPWFVFQSIGGAVATGTHGSSIEHASLSSQLVAVDLITADGSLRRFSDAPDPFLFRAVRVSVGRLGVIARVTLQIVPEEPVRRELRLVGERDFLQLVREVQDKWNLAGGAREGTGLPPAATQPKARREALLARAKAALPRWVMDGQAFWLPERRQFYLVTFQRASEAGCDVFGGDQDEEDEDLRPLVTAAAAAGDDDSNSSCAEFLRRYRPQETTQYNASRGAFSPTGLEMLVPASGGSLTLGGALRPLSAVDNVPPPFGPFASSLPALRAVADRRLTTKSNDTANEGGGGPQGVPWPLPKRHLMPAGPYATRDGNALSMAGLAVVAGNATAEASASFIRQPERTLASLRQTLYSQYEVAVPLSTAADCLGELTRAVGTESSRARAAALERRRRLGGGSEGNATMPLLVPPHLTTSTTGFFTAPLLRFVGPEDALLSLTGLDHGVALFLNLEDYLSALVAANNEGDGDGEGGDNNNNNGQISPDNNPAFKKAMAVLRGSAQCAGARLHLGKAGWPEPGCWRGDDEYGDRWCDFGCAVRALDAEEKFASAAPDRWTWAGVDLAACCDGVRGGFLTGRPGCACRVAHARAKESCPPAPFY